MALRRGATLALAALALLGTACRDQGKTTGAAIPGMALEPAGAGSAPAFCAAGAVKTTRVGPGAFDVRTAHYQLHAETSQDQAEEMGRLLEAAFPAYEAWFQATLPPGTGRLQVKLYATADGWAAGLAADGVAAPTEAGGYYASATRTAYLFEQANPYYTHVLLLHEATHQFHELSRTKGRALPFWYAEGHAEHLGRHDWDGRCVRLGTMPLSSWEDIAAHALVESKTEGIDVAAIVSGSAEADRPAAWALFHYLDAGPRRDAFKAFRDAFDAAPIDPARSFAALVGDPASLSGQLSAWLPGAQEPVRPVFTEWIHVGPRAAIGDSPEVFSLAVLKDPVTHFEARYDVPVAPVWSAGLVVGYDDENDYRAILISSDGRLRAFTATAGDAAWSEAGIAPASAGGTGTLAADFGAGGSVQVTVNGAASTFALGGMTPAAGLAIYDARVAFHDLGWR